jgi:hypothetical protein
MSKRAKRRKTHSRMQIFFKEILKTINNLPENKQKLYKTILIERFEVVFFYIVDLAEALFSQRVEKYFFSHYMTKNSQKLIYC